MLSEGTAALTVPATVFSSAWRGTAVELPHLGAAEHSNAGLLSDDAGSQAPIRRRAARRRSHLRRATLLRVSDES